MWPARQAGRALPAIAVSFVEPFGPLWFIYILPIFAW